MLRRTWLASLLAAPTLRAQSKKGELLPSEFHRYADATTEFEVIRLTSPESSSWLPAEYNRAISRTGAWMLFSSDRSGSPQAFRMDLKSGEMRQLSDAEQLDPASLALTPANTNFCYFAGRSLYSVNLANLHEREVYSVPEGWDRAAGMSVTPDGTHAVFAESKGEIFRLRMVTLGVAPHAQAAARTVIEAPAAIEHPQARPLRAQILYRQGADFLWLVNMDGRENRKLKVAAGTVGGVEWSTDGKTVLYLNFPEDRTQLNSIREFTPDANTDKLVAKTSQFASFGVNRDGSVFVGASGNHASPVILILLRITRRELTLCEHRATQPGAVSPRFSRDSQRIYFTSDRDGKPAIYCMRVDKLVEKTDEAR